MAKEELMEIRELLKEIVMVVILGWLADFLYGEDR
jgi:hypothetical protein